jgi:hypothetical protein
MAYAVMRAWATVVQLDLQLASVIGDVQAGRPVVSTTFLAYDEVAHHSGIERPDTLATLRQVDRAVARIAAVAAGDARVPGGARRRRRVRLGRGRGPRALEAGNELPEIAVMASGCLGLVSFPRLPGRVTREQVEERWPALLPALTEHRLDLGEVIGDDPLAPFGPNAGRHVTRTDGFAHCPDLVLDSTWWPETEEVAAFEELVGSHGGLGGPQAHPFVLAPAAWRWPQDGVVGAESVHRVLRGWLAALGHEEYAEPSAPAISMGG